MSSVSHGTISTSWSMIVPTISSSPHMSMWRPEKFAMISYAGWSPNAIANGIFFCPRSRYLRMMTCVCGVTKLGSPVRGPVTIVPACEVL